jgi:hypothetical protein
MIDGGDHKAYLDKAGESRIEDLVSPVNFGGNHLRHQRNILEESSAH